MDLHLRIFCMLAGTFVLIVIARLLIQRKMDESNSLVWLPVGLVALIAGFFPDLIGWVATKLNIANPDTLVLIVLVLLLVFITFRNTADISILRTRTYELSMQISMLNSEVRHLIEYTSSFTENAPGDLVHVREIIQQGARKEENDEGDNAVS